MDNRDPRMMILESDPARYIKKPSSTVLTLIKVLEGFAALIFIFRLVDIISMLREGGDGMIPYGLLNYLLPQELISLFVPAGLPAGGEVERILCLLISVCILVILAGLLVEAVLALLLRFVLKGAAVFKFVHRVIFIAFLVMAGGTGVSCVFLVFRYITSGNFLGGSVQPIIITGAAFLILLVMVSYHHSAVTVLSVVDYEIRTGFKETTKVENKLEKNSLLLGSGFLLAGLVLVLAFGADIKIAIPLFILSLKYFAVYICWTNFRHCHR